jgi:hypothetical protein
MSKEAGARRCPVILALFLGLGIPIGSPAFGQSKISVRLNDAESGKPLRRIAIALIGLNAHKAGFLTPEVISWRSDFTNTDDKGEVVFTLPDPIPAFLLVDSSPLDLHHCSDREFSTDDVGRGGIVAGYHYDTRNQRWCPKLRAQATSKPGEIVILDKRFTLWDHIRQELP